MFAVVLLIAGGCSVNIMITGESQEIPVIFPDYRDVTVPYNIAPLNFEVLDGLGMDWALMVQTNDKVLSVRARRGVFSFRNRMWKKMMADNKGTALKLTLCFKDGDGWHSCRPFDINVAGEEMDPYIAYRLIPPGYSLWKEMGIYQRELSSYKETPIYRNTQGRGNCVNCHSFRDRDPQDMLFHLRSELGGTYVFRDGVREKLDTRTDQTISALVYPFWHASGDFVAFSVNTTNQVMHVRNSNRIEVFDEASDVVVYDVNRHEIVTADILSREDAFETFPTFSPDGRSLYFCSAKAVGPMPEKFRDARYSLCRIDFDPETCSFGTKVDTLFNARVENRSVSFPRVSPDGRHLAFVVSDYGNFSLWHKEADLYCVNLNDKVVSEMEPLNSDDSESYHSWSGNSRWLVFSSRRDDGLYTKPYFAYIDEDGNAHKPFLLPQKNPKAYYDAQMYAYNIPEFIDDKVRTRGSDIASFARKDSGIQLSFRRR